MPFFRRRPRRVPLRPFDESAVVAVSPTTLEHALEEGMMLADFAVRMTLRNAITTEMLTKEGSVFAPAVFVEVARDALLALASEADAAEARIVREHHFASVLEGEPEHSHDYRTADSLNLRRREALARATAAALRERSEDSAALDALVERARAEAWSEISREIEQRIDRTFVPPDPVGMSERLAELNADLARLAVRES